MFRRISAFILSVFLLVGMLPVSAFASETTMLESETQTVPLQETTAQTEAAATDAASEPAATVPVSTEPSETQSGATAPAETTPVETAAPTEPEIAAQSDIGGTCGDNLTWTYADGVLTISGTGAMSNCYPTQPWADYCETITNVVIESGVTSIDYWAFANCSVLTTVSIPDSVTSIEGRAFLNCSSLTAVNIPDGITTIESYTFSGCSSLASITIPESVTSIGAYAFSGCTGISAFFIPESVTSIATDTFWGCDYSQRICCESSSEPSGWAYAWNRGWDAAGFLSTYYGCTRLDTTYWDTVDKTASVIEIPEGITFIPDDTFWNYTNIVEVQLPSSIRSIGEWAFYGCSNLTSINLPAGLTSIGESAFAYCEKLEEIIIPEGVTRVNNYTFQYCSSLTTVSIPASVTYIGDDAFYRCFGLRDLYFAHMASDELTIDYSAFDASNADSEYFPLTIHVPTIRDIHSAIGHDDIYSYYTVTYDYTGNIPLTAITLTEANNTTQIEAGLDLNFTAALTPADTTSELVWTASNGGIVKSSDYVSGTATIIGTEAGIMTVRCASADDASVYAEYQVNILSANADVAAITVRSDTEFENEVEVGDTVQMIADITPGNAANKEVVWEVENGTGTATIDESGHLTALTTGTVTVYATATDGTEVVGSQVINIVRYVEEITLLFNGSATTPQIGVGEPVKVTFEHLPEDATEAGVTWTLTDGTGSIINSGYSTDYILICGETAGTATLTATAKDSKKTSVSVELEVVGEKASYAVTGGNIYYNTVTGAIVDADDTVTAANIPAKINGTTITSIAPEVFASEYWYSYNSTLTTVTIPSTVTYIGDEAFYNCTALTSIRIGSGVTAIGEEAFYGCTALVNLTIPESVTSVGKNAFYNLSSLTNLTIPGTLDTRDWLSYNYGGLDTVTFTGDSIIAQPTEIYDDGWGEYVQVTNLPGRDAKQVIISDSVTTIEDYAFRSLSGIEKVTIGSGVTTVGRHVFTDCYNLAEVTLGSSMTSIGYCMFNNCQALTTVTIPDSVATIDDFAFYYCENLTSVTLGNGVTSIGASAFYDCDKLAELNLPDSLTYIGESAFEGCNNLQLLDLSSIPDTISQQNFPLDSLAEVPEVLVRATDGKVSLDWLVDSIDSVEYIAGPSRDPFGNYTLDIYSSGQILLICRDTYTGAQGSKVITCELGLEIDGLYSSYMTGGDKLNLTALDVVNNTEEKVTWSLRAEDKAYASLSTTYGSSTVLTAKAVDRAVQIQLTATSDNSSVAPEVRTLWILPPVSTITITDPNSGEILGKSGTSVKTIQADLRVTDTLTLSATTAPEDASDDVFWGSSNYNIAEVSYDGIVTTKTTGTVTITAYSGDGSGTLASFTLDIFYLDTAKKLTAKVDIPAAGLQEGSSTPIQVFGTDKTTPLDASAFVYSIPENQQEMATVDENGIVTAGSKAGTVTITASIKDDPMNRRTTVKVKVIPALTDSIFLIAEEASPAEIVMLDAIGEVTTDPEQAVRYRVYLDKEQVQSGTFKFTITANAINSIGKSMTLTKSSMKWASTDSRIAAVAANADGTATVTIKAKADGACVITATSTDLAKVEGLLEIFVRDYSPRLESASMTLNSNVTAGVSVGLTPSYGNDITSVELYEYNSKTRNYEPTTRLIPSHENGILTITHTGVLKAGTVKLMIKSACSNGLTYDSLFSLKVANKLPSITVKQSGKFNLFYTDSSAALSITAKGETVLNALVEPESTASFETVSFDPETGLLTVAFTDAYIAGNAGKPDNKVNVLVYLEGYHEPVKKAFTIATATTKPVLTMTPASSVINTATASEHNTTLRVLNKSTGQYLKILPQDVTAAFATASENGDGVKLTLLEGDGIKPKGGSATIAVRDANWTQSIKLTHKVTVQTKLPTVTMSNSNLKLNRIFTEQAAVSTITLNQQNMSIGSIRIECTDKKADVQAEAAKIQIVLDGVTITAKLDKNNLPKNGNYSFRVLVTLDDGVTELTPKTFKISVSSAVPGVKPKAGTLKLNRVLGTQYASAATTASLTGGTGYELVRFDLPADWKNNDIAVSYDENTGLITAKLLRNNAELTKHTVYLIPVLRHVETGEIQQLPTQVKLTVQVYSGTPSVALTAKGKLDATLPNSAITYTVKNFSNISGTPEAVTLEGTHGDLFTASLDTSGAAPVVTLKMAEGVKYNLKTSYKVDIVFHISGQKVSKSYSFKISQSSLKFSSVKPLNVYQFQTAPANLTVVVSAPAGAAIDQITLNSKTAAQFRRALGSGSMTVTPIGDGSSAIVSFQLEHPGYLSYGKNYALCLDVTPVSTAETVKSTQLKVNVKSCK